MTNQQKNAVVIRFCRGESVADVAVWAGASKWTVEALIRDAMSQLIQKAAEPVHG